MNSRGTASVQLSDGAAMGPSPNVENIIANHPFLHGLNSHQVRLLTDCAMPAHFAAGESIFREGDPANRFYLLRKGKVALESYVVAKGEPAPHSDPLPIGCGEGTRLGGGNVVIETLGEGEVLGWSWLFPPYVWHFGARAVEPVEAVFIYGTPLREECESDHELGYELMKRMAEIMLRRLQATRRQLLKI